MVLLSQLMDEKVYFQCVTILGDNLGVNCICGFSESFNAAYWCRSCSANNKLCKSGVEEEIAQNMSADFMHDVPEGVAVYTVSHVLDALIKEKTITLDAINKRIDSFFYS